MGKQKNKGITLISLTLYVVAMLVVVAIVAGLKMNVNKTVDSIDETLSLVPELNKLHLYFLGEANEPGNNVVKRSSDGSYIEFTSGNIYTFSKNNIYKNSIKICSNIYDCKFEKNVKNGFDVLSVNLFFSENGDIFKKMEYVLPIAMARLEASGTTEGNSKLEVKHLSQIPTNEEAILQFDKKDINSKLQIMYKIEGKDEEWNKYTEPISLSENGNVYAVLADRYGNYDEADILTVKIDYIDREAPQHFRCEWFDYYDYDGFAPSDSIRISDFGNHSDNVSDGCNEKYSEIKGYQFRVEDVDGNIVKDWHWVSLTEEYDGNFEEEYKYYDVLGLAQDTDYAIKVRAIDASGNVTEATNSGLEVYTNSVLSPYDFDVDCYPDYVNNTGVSLYIDRDTRQIKKYWMLKYQIGSMDGEWLYNTGELVLEYNANVYLRYYDRAGQYNGTRVIEIDYIDKEKPEEFDLFAYSSNNTIVVSGEVNDKGSAGMSSELIGIEGYSFCLKDKYKNVLIDWTDIQDDGEYIFEDLTIGEEYFVSMKAYDFAGNEREASNKDFRVGININTTLTPNVSTNGNAKVAFENVSGDDTLVIKYQIDGNWLDYSGEFEVSENILINGRLCDASGNVVDTFIYKVENIDRKEPEPFEFDIEGKRGRISVSAEVQDFGSDGTGSEYYGIRGYQFKLSDKNGNVLVDWTDEQESNSYTFDGLLVNETYKVSMRAIDKAGNTRDASNNEVEVIVPDSISYDAVVTASNYNSIEWITPVLNAGSYGFKVSNGAFESTNKNINSSVAWGYFKLDLSDLEGSVDVKIAYKYGSENSYDMATCHLTKTATQPAYNSSTNRLYYQGGATTTTTYTKTISSPGIYYLHFQYRKDGSVNSNIDQHIINSITITQK